MSVSEASAAVPLPGGPQPDEALRQLSLPATGSTSISRRAKSMLSLAKTAPANRRSSRCCSACCEPTERPDPLGRRAGVASLRPGDARKLGIGMVFQHFSLFEALTVAENIALSLDDSDSDRRGSPKQAAALSRPMACRSTPMPMSPISPSANASASRSSARCCRTRS